MNLSMLAWFVICSMVLSGIPHGHSVFCVWCVSTVPVVNCGMLFLALIEIDA